MGPSNNGNPGFTEREELKLSLSAAGKHPPSPCVADTFAFTARSGHLCEEMIKSVAVVVI